MVKGWVENMGGWKVGGGVGVGVVERRRRCMVDVGIIYRDDEGGRGKFWGLLV